MIISRSSRHSSCLKFGLERSDERSWPAVWARSPHFLSTTWSHRTSFKSSSSSSQPPQAHHPSRFNMPPTGLLAVFIDLGSQVTEQEFHEWYGEEHIPLRTSTLREFATAARFKLIDGVGSVSAPSKAVPRWAALYTISDNAIFRKEAYTKLRANRSPREADLVKRLGLLDRRVSTPPRIVEVSQADVVVDLRTNVLAVRQPITDRRCAKSRHRS